MNKFTIGTDPEMFATRGNKYVSAIPLIKGTKHNPEKLPHGGSISHDNVCVEFTVEPASNKEDFVQNIGDTLQDVCDYLPKTIDLNMVPSALFTKKELKHPKAKEFGCEPDYNAYTRKKNKPPKNAAKNRLRTCGGHIHIGYVEDSGNKALQYPLGKVHIVKMFDLFHGVFSAVLDSSAAALKRRELYGKPGCYRDTAYGVEYRTLSNFWLKSPQLVKLIYYLTEDVLTLVKDNKSVPLLTSFEAKDIQAIITEGKVMAALQLIRDKLLKYLSEDSKVLFDICFFKAEEYDFMEQWEIT